jgi:hypothetical protein
MKIIPTLLFSMLAGLSATAFAQWQWIDNDGHKVFSDRAPPPDIVDKNILKRPNSRAVVSVDDSEAVQPVAAPVLVPGAAKATGVDKELEARKKQAADAEAAKRKAEQDRITKAKVENCARAKQAKASLESGVRISRTNAAGEREFMDDSAKANELQRIQGIVASDCN